MHALALIAAAASWSAPQTVSAPHTFVGPLLAGADQHGRALAAWSWQDGVGDNVPTGAAQVTVRDGTVSAEQKAPIGIVAVAGYGDGRSLELASRQLNPSGTRWRLTVKDGARTTRLATGFILFRPQLAVAPDGTALVAWVEVHGQRHVVRAAMRSRAGSFGRPVSLVSSGQTTLVSAAVSKRGDA